METPQTQPPWSDRSIIGDETYDYILHYLDTTLPGDENHEQEESDPTQVPVSNLLIIYS